MSVKSDIDDLKADIALIKADFAVFKSNFKLLETKLTEDLGGIKSALQLVWVDHEKKKA